MERYPQIVPSGDSAVIVEFDNEISRETNGKVRALLTFLISDKPSWFRECVPSYRSLLIEYDPLTVTYDKVLSYVKFACQEAKKIELTKPKLIEIPTLYGGEFGPDLSFVAAENGLPPDEVVRLHSGTDYLVYMLGFTPGFPYLGEMNPKIACPRKKTPRTKIPAGSVGIAGQQTGVYPLDSPGGWQIIGRTPLRLFSPLQEPPILLQPGNLVRFVPISEGEYCRLEQGKSLE